MNKVASEIKIQIERTQLEQFRREVVHGLHGVNQILEDKGLHINYFNGQFDVIVF